MVNLEIIREKEWVFTNDSRDKLGEETGKITIFKGIRIQRPISSLIRKHSYKTMNSKIDKSIAIILNEL
jgi:hypothetical protein